MVNKQEAQSLAQRANAANPRIRATVQPIRKGGDHWRVNMELLRAGNTWRMVKVHSEEECEGVMEAWQEASEVA